MTQLFTPVYLHTWAVVSSGTTHLSSLSTSVRVRQSCSFWTRMCNFLGQVSQIGHNYLWDLLSRPAHSYVLVGLWSSCQLLRHCRKECLRVLGGRISLVFITLRGQCKSVAAVYLLSFLLKFHSLRPLHAWMHSWVPSIQTVKS